MAAVTGLGLNAKAMRMRYSRLIKKLDDYDKDTANDAPKVNTNEDVPKKTQRKRKVKTDDEKPPATPKKRNVKLEE